MATSFAQFSGSGSGTESDPYLIYNETQLSQMANFLNQEGVVFSLKKDLNLTNWIAENSPSQGWLPIGVESSPFKGTLLGNGKTIRGFSVSRSGTSYVGFFGHLDGATVSDLTIVGSNVSGAQYTGIMAGCANSSTITNVNVKMTTLSGGQYSGGFIGYASGSNLTNVNVELTTLSSGGQYSGGLIGYAFNTTVTMFSVKATFNNAQNYKGGVSGYAEGCTFDTGTVEGNITALGYCGGAFGFAKNTTLQEITATGNINASGLDDIGGVVGLAEGSCTFSSCKHTGDITGATNLGGIVGEIVGGSSVTLTSCWSKGKITGSSDYIGGVVGKSNGASIAGIEGCSHFGDISGGNYVGGIVGAITSEDTPPTLYNYYAFGQYNTSETPTWIIKETISNGTTTTNAVNNCTMIGNISGSNYVGGMIGSNLSSFGYTSESNYTYATVDKTPKAALRLLYKSSDNGLHYSYVQFGGKFTYYNYKRNITIYDLTNSYYSGNITGSAQIGGLVGVNGGGNIYCNYSYGSIYGTDVVGGIVGKTVSLPFNNLTVSSSVKSNMAICSTISASSSDASVGRIFGVIGSTTTIGATGSAEGNSALTQCKLIKTGVTQTVSDDDQNGSSIGPSLLKLKATYVAKGWSMDSDWNILETESYPFKKYQAAPPVIESELVSGATSISGSSMNGGTVYLLYKDYDAVSTNCSGNSWSFSTEALQSGAQVKIYAEVDDLVPSCFTITTVKYPGSGIKADPYRIYTAEDLQGANKTGYYKLMNDIDLTSWINENSPTKGWVPIGLNSNDATYIDGDNHRVTGLWANTVDDYTGLFSNYSAGEIKNLTVEVATGKKVKGGNYTGILIGRMANGTISNCTVVGGVEGLQYTGGIVGYADNTPLTNLITEGQVAGTSSVGGMAGYVGGTSSISRCSATSTITATGNAGGLVGDSSAPISKSKADATITVSGDNSNVGGLVGNTTGSVQTSFATGSITVTGADSNTGGLIGYVSGTTVANSYSTADVSGTQYNAGLVAYALNTVIDKCYAKGDVSGVNYGGGLVAQLDGSDASLSNSVAANNILSLSAQSSWGSRVIGGYKNGASEPGENNYALSTMQVSLNGVPQTKTDDPVEGIAKSQADLMSAATYLGLGWDFTDVWGIDEGESYPTLNNTAVEPGVDPDPEPILTDDDNIVVEEVTAIKGQQTSMNIDLENKTTNLTAFQFDLTLPDGISLSLNDKGKYVVTKTDRFEDDDQTLNISKTGNTYRIISFSMSNEIITGTSGAILNASLTVGESVNVGRYEATINNIVLTKTDGKQLKLKDAKFNIVVTNVIMGDVNGDGEVNVSDIVEIVNYIMGKPSNVFVEAAADLNDDGEINVTDIVNVVSIIMSANSSNAPKRASVSEMVDNDKLTLSVEGENSYSLCLDNDAEYVASQFELRLANGQQLESMRMNEERIDGHLMKYAKIDDNLYKVIVYSPENRPFRGGNDRFFTFNVSGRGSVEVSNILFVTNGVKEKQFPSLYAETTSIDIIKTHSTMDIYDIDGRLIRKQVNAIENLQKGVYIINGKKIVIR